MAWLDAHQPQWTWQPSDAVADAFSGIETRVAQEGLANVRPPVLLDVMAAPWLPTAATFDLVYCANMLHISPWATCTALMQGSARHLAADGVLVTYGPYLEADVPTAPGNLAFDQSLRTRNPASAATYPTSSRRRRPQAGLRVRRLWSNARTPRAVRTSASR